MSTCARRPVDPRSDRRPLMQDTSDGEDWGRLYVTRMCCGAATCRNYAPELLGEVALPHERAGDHASVLPGSRDPGAFTGVLRQPRSKAELAQARTAAAACPYGAIRLE